MPPTLQLTSVHLRVADLARSLAFYSGQLGFVVSHSTPTRADLSVTPTSPPLLTLTGDSAAPPAEPDAAGLFHAALLFPSRAALGAWLHHASTAGVVFDGASDHGVSEALYFRDPDGHGLEFYVDRPRAAWPFSSAGELAMTTARLDVPGLLAAAAPPTPHPLAGSEWGHLHLRVTDLVRSEAFYRATLGVTVTQSSYPGARFLAADGYHHHLGLNTWGRPRAPHSSAALGLVSATFARRRVSSAAPMPKSTSTSEAGVGAATIADPDGIALHLTTSP